MKINALLILASAFAANLVIAKEPKVVLFVSPETVENPETESHLFFYSEDELRSLGMKIEERQNSVFFEKIDSKAIGDYKGLYKSATKFKAADLKAMTVYSAAADSAKNTDPLWIFKFAPEIGERGKLTASEATKVAQDQKGFVHFEVKGSASGTARFYHQPNGAFANCWDFAIRAVGPSGFGSVVGYSMANIQPGNVLLAQGFSWDGNSGSQHYFVVESVNGDMVTTLESNFNGNNGVIRANHYKQNFRGSLTVYQGTAGQ